MADLATTIHETIERHRYAVPAGEMSYRHTALDRLRRPGDPICSCGWRPPKPNGELHSRHVATEVARAVLACLRDLTPHEAAKALYAAVRTDPAVQDAMLAALAEGGRLVEERRQPCSCGSESVGPLRIGHLLADAHTSLRERARYVTHWREVPDAD